MSSQITIKPAAGRSAVEIAEIVANPGFGRVFTDHMAVAKWSTEKGWHDLSIEKYAPLQFDPAMLALHYGQSIFEGMKAYRWNDGTINTFRPLMNANRFQRSAKRLAMPEPSQDLFLSMVQELVKIDQAYVPSGGDKSLYIRPFMFASEVGLGVRPATEYLFLVIASPVGAYFDPAKAVSVWVSTEFVRAAPGGTGEAKCAGNYAASLIAQAQAKEQGCDQVIWLDAIERKWIEEMGGMNLFFVMGSGDEAQLLTPSLTGTLLPGVTRDSLIKLGNDLGIETHEGKISIDELRSSLANGKISEVFACGTAAVISPVGMIKGEFGEIQVGNGLPGEITMRLRKALLDLQTGLAPDENSWMYRLV
ncbi:MAG: branched-chain amino acid aminotransferase [actinobacterium acAMD-5]|nr:MAG: branched-chain amino acid aminotransferase [actinobacterium acAMD-5]